MQRKETYELTQEEIDELVSRGVEIATEELKEHVAELKQELRNGRSALTLSQAATYFSGRVGRSTLKDNYIKGRKLPKGVDHALPARRVGNVYFVEREVLERWLMGRTSKDELYPWQKD